MRTKNFVWTAAAASLGILMIGDAALAHCQDARKTCEFTAQCMHNNGTHEQRIRDGAHMRNAAGGHEIWGELAGGT